MTITGDSQAMKYVANHSRTRGLASTWQYLVVLGSTCLVLATMFGLPALCTWLIFIQIQQAESQATTGTTGGLGVRKLQNQ